MFPVRDLLLGMEDISAALFGLIHFMAGGYVLAVTNSLPTALQYVTAVGFLTATIALCMVLIRKKENWNDSGGRTEVIRKWIQF